MLMLGESTSKQASKHCSNLIVVYTQQSVIQLSMSKVVEPLAEWLRGGERAARVVPSSKSSS